MIIYHGTPIGGARLDVTRFLAGRHALVPFPRPDDLAAVAEVCQSFILDNGAYTIWKQGGQLDYAGYVAWVEKWHRHPGFQWAVIPDVIGGTAAENDAMLARWPAHLKGVPVYHMHEPLERLVRLASAYEIVALGGSDKYPTLKSKTWWTRMREMMRAVCDEEGRPHCRLHGLRMLDPEVFTVLPLASADSTNAARNNSQLNRFGMYTPPSAAQRADVIASRIEGYNSAPLYREAGQQVSLFDSKE
jgi:hypothetical protein